MNFPEEFSIILESMVFGPPLNLNKLKLRKSSKSNASGYGGRGQESVGYGGIARLLW
jgi:hypothetical protein